MENNSSGQETVTTSQASAEVSTPVETTSQAAPATETSPQAQTPATEWKPDYKFKANGEEHEIDEEYRAYIKSQDDEKRIKRMFEQFKGVDKLKTEWHGYKTKIQEYEPAVKKAENYDMSFQAFNKLVAEGQYKRAFDLFQIPKEIMYKAALQYAEFDELPQQQKQVYNQLREQEQYNQQISKQYEDAQARLAQVQTETRKAELQQVLMGPEIKSVAEKYDQAYGAGSFRQEVINRGKSHFALTGEDLNAQQVAESLVKMVKPFLSAQPVMSQPQATTPAGIPQAKADVPVIPATGSSSGSPGEMKIKSIADLKKVAAEKLSGRSLR